MYHIFAGFATKNRKNMRYTKHERNEKTAGGWSVPQLTHILADAGRLLVDHITANCVPEGQGSDQQLAEAKKLHMDGKILSVHRAGKNSIARQPAKSNKMQKNNQNKEKGDRGDAAVDCSDSNTFGQCWWSCSDIQKNAEGEEKRTPDIDNRFFCVKHNRMDFDIRESGVREDVGEL